MLIVLLQTRNKDTLNPTHDAAFCRIVCHISGEPITTNRYHSCSTATSCRQYIQTHTHTYLNSGKQSPSLFCAGVRTYNLMLVDETCNCVLYVLRHLSVYRIEAEGMKQMLNEKRNIIYKNEGNSFITFTSRLSSYHLTYDQRMKDNNQKNSLHDLNGSLCSNNDKDSILAITYDVVNIIIAVHSGVAEWILLCVSYSHHNHIYHQPQPTTTPAPAQSFPFLRALCPEQARFLTV